MKVANDPGVVAWPLALLISVACTDDTAVVIRHSDTVSIVLADSILPSDIGIVAQDLRLADTPDVSSADPLDDAERMSDIFLDISSPTDEESNSSQDTTSTDVSTRTELDDSEAQPLDSVVPPLDSDEIMIVPQLSWSDGAPLPSARVGTVVGGYAGKLMVTTGEGPQGTLTADIQLLNTDSGIWGTSSMEFSPIRRYAAGAVVQAQLYVVLGLAPNNQGVDSFVRYNPAEDAWMVLLANPNPGCCAGATSAKEKIWVLGGRLASTLTQSFSPAQGVWLTHQPMPVGTSFPAVVTDQTGDSIYVLGGSTADTPDGGTTLAAVQRYSIQTNEWTILAALPEPRAAASAVWLDGKVWLLGGESNSEPAQNSVFVYSPAGDLWMEAEPMPTARSRHGAAVLGDSIYLVGGIHQLGEPLNGVDIGNIKMF